MSEITTKTIELLEMLPEDDQKFTFEFIKKLVLAWDPDFTKLIDNEKALLEKTKSESSFNSFEIDWNNLNKIDLD